MVNTNLLLRRTLLVHLRALLLFTVAVVGSPMRGAAVSRFAATTRRLIATTTSGSVWLFSSLLLPARSGFASRAAAGTKAGKASPAGRDSGNRKSPPKVARKIKRNMLFFIA